MLYRKKCNNFIHKDTVLLQNPDLACAPSTVNFASMIKKVFEYNILKCIMDQQVPSNNKTITKKQCNKIVNMKRVNFVHENIKIGALWV